MSEAAAEAPVKKKKGKLPVILALVAVLAGGGFFMMKGKGGKKEVPKVALAEKETEIEEFLTNTANPNVYVRAKIAVKLRKDYEEAKFVANIGDVRDAILIVLNSTAPSKITSASNREALKKALAEAMNTALEGPLEAGADEHGKAADEHGKAEEPKRKGKVTEIEAPKKDEHGEKAERMDDWDSKTGPVLKVRFVNLATQ